LSRAAKLEQLLDAACRFKFQVRLARRSEA